jgi:hypothetical protein
MPYSMTRDHGLFLRELFRHYRGKFRRKGSPDHTRAVFASHRAFLDELRVAGCSDAISEAVLAAITRCPAMIRGAARFRFQCRRRALCPWCWARHVLSELHVFVSACEACIRASDSVSVVFLRDVRKAPDDCPPLLQTAWLPSWFERGYENARRVGKKSRYGFHLSLAYASDTQICFEMTWLYLVDTAKVPVLLAEFPAAEVVDSDCRYSTLLRSLASRLAYPVDLLRTPGPVMHAICSRLPQLGRFERCPKGSPLAVPLSTRRKERKRIEAGATKPEPQKADKV